MSRSFSASHLAGPAADGTVSAMDALDEQELDGGAWGETELDIGGEEDDIDAVGGEYEGGDPDDADADEGWEMEVPPFLPLPFSTPSCCISPIPHLFPH